MLVRLAAVDRGLLAELLEDAWRCVAPRKLLEAAGPNDQPDEGRGA